MAMLTRRDPFVVPLSTMVEAMLREPLFGDGSLSNRVEEGTLALDVSEDEASVIVRASLPGFSREDVEVEIHDGVLSIKATHVEEKEEGGKGERYYRKERRVGSMSRRIALPSQVQEHGAKAELKDGVLSLRIPKVAKEQPRKIAIG